MENPTQEQLDIFEAALTTKDNLCIDAKAGTGKTSTIVEMMHRVSGTPLQPEGRFGALALAFNHDNAKDLRKRMPSWVNCKTFHGLGFAAWMRYLRCRYDEITVDDEKINRLVSRWCRENDGDDFWMSIREVTRMAKANGVVPPSSRFFKRAAGSVRQQGPIFDLLEDFGDEKAVEHNTEVMWNAVIWVLDQSINEAMSRRIDFDDMIYMPLAFGASFNKFKWILVDEAQDLNSAQHRILTLSLAYRGRIIAVGDPMQAIYGWRGADTRSMERLIEQFDMKRLPLTVNWRCGLAIVRQAQKIVPDLKPRPDYWIGKVSVLDSLDPEDVPEGATVLCRNNAPILKLAFRLIREGMGFTYTGRDFGKVLMSTVKKITKNKPHMLVQDFLPELELLENREIEEAELKNKFSQVTVIRDRFEALRTVAASLGGETQAEKIREALYDMLNQTGSRTLSTIHKAKGKEWPEVYFLEPGLIPNHYTVKTGIPELIQQETNLRYVAETRAKEHLVYCSFERKFTWPIVEVEEEEQSDA